MQAVFQVAPASISSWFLCPHPPLLLGAPNQNRHDTQAGFHLACSAGVFFGRANFFALENAMLLCLLSLIFLRHKIKDGGYNNTNINKQLSPAQNTPALQARFHSVRFTYYLSRQTLVYISQTALGYLVMPTQSNCIYVLYAYMSEP